jgi:hypothetical protein
MAARWLYDTTHLGRARQLLKPLCRSFRRCLYARRSGVLLERTETPLEAPTEVPSVIVVDAASDVAATA